MLLDVIGDEIVLRGQVVGKLVGRAAETTTLNDRIVDLLRNASDEVDDPLDDADDNDLIEEIHDRDLHARVIVDMSDDELKDALDLRAKKRAA